MEVLIFTIYAPLASWGEIAVGEHRNSWDRPSRSAVLGLVAAGLGIRRDEQAAHDALDRSLGVAVRLDAVGTPLVDYHTAQTVAETALKKRRPATRAALLATVGPDERQTILSRREYRQDALATVALWIRDESTHSLAKLREALRRPHFTLYAGRKANVLGVPLMPEIVSAATLANAFASRAPAPQTLPAERLRPRAGWGREIAYDPCPVPTGLDVRRREIRRDTKPHRTRWQFEERVVEVGVPAEPGGAGDEVVK